MAKDPRIPLRDIVESCNRIITNLNNITIDQFDADVNLQDAVIRRFEIIGEAAKHIPESIRAQYPDIPWKEVVGFRDVLIHDYPNIVADNVYYTGTVHLPKFRDQIQGVLNDLDR